MIKKRKEPEAKSTFNIELSDLLDEIRDPEEQEMFLDKNVLKKRGGRERRSRNRKVG